MDLQIKIAQIISNVLEEKVTKDDIQVSRDLNFGHLNSGLLIDRDLKNNLKTKLISGLDDLVEIEKVEIVKPGFLNIYLSEKGKEVIIENVLEKRSKDYIEPDKQNKKVQIEYVSANPTGPLTLGNGRGAFAGETLANVYELLGYDVKREYYINNIGRQVEILADSVISKIEGKPRKYQDKDLYKGDYIADLAKKFDYKQEESLIEIGQSLAELMINKHIKPTLSNLGIEFDKWQKESDLYQEGVVSEALSRLESKNYLTKKAGALWFKSKEFGDEKNRVVKRRNGDYTYFASDIGYAYDKFKSRDFDRVINFWGADHHGYIDRYRGMLKSFGWEDKWQVIIFQLVNLIEKKETVKMSKREGKFVLLSDLVKEVGPDVVKFVFISRDYNSVLDIDLDLIKSKSKDSPVYYIQYAFARINSIQQKKDEIKANSSSGDDYYFNKIETELLLELLKFESVLASIVTTKQVHLLANYSNDLAKKFHSFYRHCPVLKTEKNIREKRIKLTLATKKILKTCLELMGLEQPEKM